MKERGMIFNADMVRAVLNGSKTQTRRIMKVQPSTDFSPMNMELETDFTARWYTPGVVDKDGYLQPAKKQVFGVASEDEGYTCPFSAVGDRLWVRETFSVVPRTAYAASEGVQQVICPDDSHEAAIFRAGWEHSTGGIRWRPSIHMPRWASRIALEITGARIERLRDISEEDATTEGVPPAPEFPETYLTPKGDYATAKVAFQRLWESIYGVDSWQANPWVWVIEFKRVEGE